MDFNTIDLIGERAHLMPLIREHTESLFQAGLNPDIWRFSSRKIETREDMEKLVEEALENKEKGLEVPFIIYDRWTNKVVGSTRYLNISIHHRNLEIGWTWLSPEVWRTRINTESKYMLLNHGFESLNTLRIQFKADIRNVRSNQAIERLGAFREGVLRRDRILNDGHVRDACIYSIIKEEWPTIRERLRGFLTKE